jgi:general secretion pathway protein L
MSDFCVLRLVAPASAEWVTVDASGARASAVARGTLAEAAAACGGRRLVVLVPSADVVLAMPEIPARAAGAKLLKLVPFALEEQLAQDVETLHFAVGRADADRRVPVAAVDRARMAEWLALLREAGLSPAAMYPEGMAVPANPAHIVLLLDGERVFVRRPGALPLTLEADPIDATLAVAGVPPLEPEAGPNTHVIVYASPADWEAHRAAIEALRPALGSLKVQLLPDGPLPLLAATSVTEPPFTLLQGDYALRQGFAGEWPRWRLAAGLLAGFLALHLLTLGIDWWRARQQEALVDQQLRAAAAEALPNVQNLDRLPSVRAAVDARLRASRAAVSEGLLGTLGAVASATAQTPGTLVESLDYRNGVTDLQLDAPNVDAIDRLQQLVGTKGFRAEMRGASQRGERYQGRLELKGPGT